MDQNSKVITVSDVINFIQKESEKMTAFIKGTSSNIKKIVDTVDASDIKNSNKKLNAFAGYVDKYNGIMSSIIKSFTVDLSDSKSLNDLLGMYQTNETGADGKLIKKTKYSVLEAMNQIPAIITSVFKNIDTIVGFDLKFGIRKTKRKVEQNMSIMSKSMTDIISTIKKTFIRMDFGKDFNEIMGFLTNDPQTITTILEKSDNSEKVDDKNIKNDIKEVTNTITTNGRVGLIDCINGLFGMISIISQFQVPQTKTIKQNIKYAGSVLSGISSSLTKPISLFNKYKKEWIEFAKIGGDKGILISTLQQFPKITESLEIAFPIKSIIRLKLIGYMISDLKNIITNLHKKIVNNKTITIFSDKDSQNKLSNTKKSISTLGEIVVIVNDLALPFIKILVISKPIKWGISSLSNIVNNISELFNDIKDKDFNEDSIKNLDSGLLAIHEMTGNVVKLGVSMIRLIFIKKLITGGIKRLFSIVLKLSYFSKTIGKYNIDEVVGKVSDIFSSLNDSFKNIIEVGKRSVLVIVMCNFIKAAISKVGSILKRVRDVVKFVNKNDFDSDNLSVIEKTMGSIAGIFINLSKIGPHAMILMVMQSFIIDSMTTIAIIFDEYVQLVSILKSKKVDSKSILILKDVVGGLLSISKDFIKLALIALPATLATYVSIIFVKALGNFVILLVGTFNKEASIKKVRKGIYHIGDIVEELMRISGLIMLFALISPVVALAAIVAMVGVLAIWAFVKVTSILFRGISSMMTKLLLNIIKFSIIIGLISIVLLVAAATLMIIASVAEPVLRSMGIILLFIVSIAGIAMTMILLGATLSLLTPIMLVAMIGLGAMVGMLVTLFGVALLLDKIASYKLDRATIESSMGAIIESIKVVSEALVTNVVSSVKAAKSGKRVLKQVRKTFDHIKGIAETLNFIQGLTIDQNKIDSNVDSIMFCVGSLEQKLATFNGVVMDQENKEESLLQQIKNAKLQKKTFRQNKKMLRKVDKVLIEVNSIAEKLEFLSNFKLDDKQKSNIENNISNILGYVNQLGDKLAEFNGVSAVKTDGNLIEQIKNARAQKKVFRQNKKMLNKVDGVLLEINDVAEKLKFISELKIDREQVLKNVESIMGGVNVISTYIMENSLLNNEKDPSKAISFIKAINDSVKDVTSISKEQAGTTEKTLDNYGKFIEKINTVKVENLEKSTAMFKQMARFSESIEGNFERLADALNEKIMPLLEEMKEISGQVPAKLDQGFANTSATVAATAAGPMSQSSMTAQVQRENPNMSKKDIERVVDNRMKDQAKNQAQSLTAKIDEVIELLQGSGKIKVVPV